MVGGQFRELQHGLSKITKGQLYFGLLEIFYFGDPKLLKKLKMKKVVNALFLFLSLIQVITAQNYKISKIIVDKITKIPLPYANVSNGVDATVSNVEGLFSFVSSKNEINFSFICYEPLETTFEAINKQDTIFLQPKAINLEEIVVGDMFPYMKKVLQNIRQNYKLTPYTENFFLRNVLKRDNQIERLQDIHGKSSRSAMFTNSDKIEFSVEILNMRKTGILGKSDAIYFKFPDFNEFYAMILPKIDTKYVAFREEKVADTLFKKINFESKESDEFGQKINGYLVINKFDYAIVEYYISMYDEPEKSPYHETPFFSKHQYRTMKYDKTVRFSKNANNNKYYLSSAKFDCQLEVLADKKIDKTFYYTLSMEYFTSKSFTNETIKSNFSVEKDIFKAKFPYSDEFWKNQNQLPLTTDLKDFLTTVAEKKNKKEFEIIGNF